MAPDSLLQVLLTNTPQMADNMSLNQIPLTIIVAATAKNGIGKNGGLPWPMLKKDMAYFARVTKRVPMPKDTGSAQSDALKESLLSGTRRNVVIMGRKTWDSIPPKFRPLKDRTNVVISSQERGKLGPMPDNVIVASDISTGLHMLESLVKKGEALPVGRAFVIGGSSIYRAALQLPQTNRVLLTRVFPEYDCDTFFPAALDESSRWKRVPHAEMQDFVGEHVDEGPVTHDIDGVEVSMDFQLHERD